MSVAERKEDLRLLSLEARDLKEALIKKADTINEAAYLESLRVNDIIIKYFYTDSENVEFHTYKGWQELGFQVQKGSKTFAIWGRKRQNIDDKTAKEENRDKYKFYPLAFLFSNMQVKKIEQEEERH